MTPTANNLSHSKMSHGHRQPNAEGRRERLTNNISIAASGVRDVESTEVMSKKIDTKVVPQRSAGKGTTSSKTFEANTVDEECDSGASTDTSLCMQRGNEESEKSVVPFIKRDPDNVASTLDWRRRVMHSQEATPASNSRQWQTAEEIEIEGIRRRCREQEKMLKREIKLHEERYAEWLIEKLEGEEKDEKKDHPGPAAGWWDPQPDYEPTECGD